MYASLRGQDNRAADTVLLVFADNDRNLLPLGSGLRDEADKVVLPALAKRKEFSGDAGSMAIIDVDGSNDRWLVCGIGKPEKVDVRAVQALGGRIVDRLNDMKAASVHLAHGSDGSLRIGAQNFDAARPLGEGFELGRFRFEQFKTKKNASNGDSASVGEGEKEKGPEELLISAADSRVLENLRTGMQYGACANFSRNFSSMPPNIANPTYIAAEARSLADACGLHCEVIAGADLEAQNLIGLSTVGRASETPPCLVVLRHAPPGTEDQSPIVLIGKTLTYDTGGLSLKPGPSMRGMKADKNGGMAVLGAMRAIGEMKPNVPVIALLPTAENAVAGNAFRPDDIIRYPNGVTVEVTNTDAEGRLVLADALAYACAKLSPRAMVDIATLTGGVVTALGSACAGLWCANDDLKKRVQEASARTGERVWELPLWEDYRDMMKAKVADIWNSAPERSAHPIQGAAFLSFFVKEEVPWAHIDIAGVSVTDRDRPPFVTGPTGFGARLLADLVMHWA